MIDTVQGGRHTIVKESADLIYNPVVLWISADIHPDLVGKSWNAANRSLILPGMYPKKLLRVSLKECEPPRASGIRQCAVAAKPSTRLALELIG